MRSYFSILLLLFWFSDAIAQEKPVVIPDTNGMVSDTIRMKDPEGNLYAYSWESDTLRVDTLKKDSSGKLYLYQLGGFISDGTTQYFEGFNHSVLYNNSNAGLPLYSDWAVYSNQVLIPQFFKFGAYVSFMDTIRHLKVRLGAFYYRRADSMAYVSGFAINDTIFGRQASEVAGFVGVSGAAMITSRRLFKFFRLYGGVNLEFAFSPTSKINFLEYSFDFGDQLILELNQFQSKGKPRMDMYGSAILGMETYFGNRLGLTFEARSGAGLHIILREPSVGISKTVLMGGLNYYFRRM